MFDNYSGVLLKIVTGKKLSEEENAILLKEFNSLLRKAAENRIEFLFLKTIKNSFPKIFEKFSLDVIYEDGEKKSSDFHKTVSIFQRDVNGKNCAIIKTYYPFPTIVSDIDILFFEKDEYQRFVKRMGEKGFFYTEDDDLKGSLKKQGFLKCEPHNDISWYGMRFISKDFIKRNLIEKRIGKSTFVVPNKKAAFVISAAHILFDCQYLSIRDYLFLQEYASDKEIANECIKEAEKFGWGKAAVYIINVLKKGEKLSFPFWIPIFTQYSFFKNKLVFDFVKKGKNSFSVESVLLPFVYYFWKRIRSKFSRRIYRNSWLY